MSQTSLIEWIPVAERLPTDDLPRLVASPGTVLMATLEGPHWVNVAAGRVDDGKVVRYVIPGVTHWAELPDTLADKTDAEKGSQPC